jgi:hypothetical protein
MRILSYNVSHQFWTCALDKLAWICAQINHYNANMVCLQHVYTERARLFVYRRLRLRYPYNTWDGGFMVFAEQPFESARYRLYKSNCALWETGFVKVKTGGATLYVVDSPTNAQYMEVLEDAKADTTSALLAVLGTFGSEVRLQQTCAVCPGSFDANDVGMRMQFSYVDGTRPDVVYVLRCPPRCFPDSVIGMIGHLWISPHLPLTITI